MNDIDIINVLNMNVDNIADSILIRVILVPIITHLL